MDLGLVRPRHQEVGGFGRDRVGGLGAGRIEPSRRPVGGAQHGADDQRRIGRDTRPSGDAFRDQIADRALVSVALADDARAQSGGECVGLQMRRRALDLVQQNVDVVHQDLAQAIGHRARRVSGAFDAGQHAIQRAVVTVVEDFVLAAEVV